MNSVARARALGASCLSFFSQRKGLVHVPWSKMGSPYKWYGNSCEKCSCRFITYHYALMRYDSILYIYIYAFWYMWDLIHCKGDGLGSLQSGCYFDTSNQASKDDMHPVKHLADGCIFTFYWWMFHKKTQTPPVTSTLKWVTHDNTRRHPMDYLFWLLIWAM